MDFTPTKRRRRTVPLHAAILIGACLAGLAIVALDGWRTWQSRAGIIADDKVETANLARSLSQHVHDLIQATDAVLLGLRERVEVDGTSPASLDRMHNFMVDQVANLPVLHGLFLYDASGQWLTNALPGASPRLNNADRAYFRYHREHSGRGVHLGPPVRSKSDGGWIITVSRRIDAPDGSFGGVVIATISVNSVADYYGTFDVRTHGAIALTMPDGVIITRVPSTLDVTGLDVSTGSIFGEVKLRPVSGSFEYKSTIDNIERLGSYRRADDYFLYSIVSHGMDDILTDWRSDAVRHLEISLGAAVVIIVLGARFARQIRRSQTMQRRYRLLADNSSDAILCVGPQGRMIYVSPAFTSMTGWSIEECLEQDWGDRVHPEDATQAATIQAQFESGLDAATIRFRLRRKDGGPIWVEAGIQHVADVDGERAVFVANIRDITQRKAAEDQVHALNLELSRQANTDALTGLGNRRSFDAALALEWRRAYREGFSLSLLMIDVDRFKLFNDRYGHQAGDTCLSAVAGAVAQAMRRPGDFACRYGGEEIVVLLPSTPEAGALEIANRVRAAIEMLQIPHAGNPPSGVVTASFGVATASPRHQAKTDGAKDLVHEADAALYHAKQNGRNQVCVGEITQNAM